MDTTWFAVDDEGRVAVFESEESGGHPEVVQPISLAAEALVYEALLPRTLHVIEHDPYETLARLDELPGPSNRGFYHFVHGRDYAGAAYYYQRVARPLQPLHIDQLPREIRAECFRFEGVRFEAHPIVQPLDLVSGVTYLDEPHYSLAHGDLRRWTRDGSLVIASNAESALREEHRDPSLKPARIECAERLESLCAQGRLPLDWLTDTHRRWLCDGESWRSLGLLDELRDADGLTSVAVFSSAMLWPLARDVRKTLAAERLAMEARGARTVYWRGVSREVMDQGATIHRDAFDAREKAIVSLGFLLDPVLTSRAVLWVCID